MPVATIEPGSIPLMECGMTLWHRRWIQRRLIALAASTVLLGGLAACSYRHGHGLMTDADALMAGGQQPRVELQALVAGRRFDRGRAQTLINAKTSAVHDKAPAVVTAMADFYDSLQPAQQQKLRDFMNRGRGWRHAG